MSVQIKGVGTIGGIDQGLNTVGIITATSFVGSGANLTNLPAQATIANNADNRIITGGSGVNLNAESNVLYDGTNFGINKSPSRTLDVGGIIRSSHSVCFGDNSSTPSEGAAIHRPAASTLAFVTNNTEKLRIGESGQIGIGGANYGTSGQVLTSQGSGSAVQWASIANGYGVFDVKHGSSAQSIPRVTYTKVEFKSKIYDLDNVFSTTDYRYTPQVAGYYYVFFTIVLTGQVSGYEIYAEIKKNGSSVMKSHSGGSQNYGSLGQADVYGFVQMNGTSDYLDSFIWHNNANSASRSPDVNYTRMGGYLVRRS